MSFRMKYKLYTPLLEGRLPGILEENEGELIAGDNVEAIKNMLHIIREMKEGHPRFSARHLKVDAELRNGETNELVSLYTDQQPAFHLYSL